MKRFVSVVLSLIFALTMMTACSEKVKPEEQAALDLMAQVIAGDLSTLENCTGYQAMPADFDMFEETVKTVRAKTTVQVLETTDHEDGTYTVVLGADAPDLLTAYTNVSVAWLDKAINDPTLTDTDIQAGIQADLEKDETVANWKIQLLVTVAEDESVTIDVTDGMASIEAVYTCNLTTILE